MVKKVENTKQGDTSKNTFSTKHQVTTNNKMEKRGTIWEDIPTFHGDGRSKSGGI